MPLIACSVPLRYKFGGSRHRKCPNRIQILVSSCWSPTPYKRLLAESTGKDLKSNAWFLKQAFWCPKTICSFYVEYTVDPRLLVVPFPYLLRVRYTSKLCIVSVWR